ncbi:MAG: hypothetical protein ACR2QO_29080 [Acidimicrobiales bacterium]
MTRVDSSDDRARPQLKYLSDEWLEAADAALAGQDPLPVRLRVGYRVMDGPPDGASVRSHTLVLGPERVGIVGSLVDPTVTLTMAWEVASAIAQGRASAQRAFLDGLVQLDGQPDALLGHQDHLSAVDDLLASVRAETSYEYDH